MQISQWKNPSSTALDHYGLLVPLRARGLFNGTPLITPMGVGGMGHFWNGTFFKHYKCLVPVLGIHILKFCDLCIW